MILNLLDFFDMLRRTECPAFYMIKPLAAGNKKSMAIEAQNINDEY